MESYQSTISYCADPGRIHHGGTEARSKTERTTSGFRTLGTVSLPLCLCVSVVN